MSKSAKSKEMAEDEMLEAAKELHARAQAMLSWPIERTTLSVGQSGLSITIEPAGWNKSTPIDLLKAATDLERMVFNGSLRPKARRKSPEKKPATPKRSRVKGST